MDEELTSFGLGPDEVADLFRTCSDTGQSEDNEDEDEKKAMLLNDLLAEPVSQQSLRGGGPSEKIPALTRTLQSLVNLPLRDLLQDDGTSVDLLIAIKEQAKELSVSARSELERQAVNTIYYTAIARALASHSQKITSYSLDDLGQSFERLASEQWIPRRLRELFERASKLCQLGE